jgi:hypothetical protein
MTAVHESAASGLAEKPAIRDSGGRTLTEYMLLIMPVDLTVERIVETAVQGELTLVRTDGLIFAVQD